MKRLIQNIILAVLAILLVVGIVWARNRSQGEVCSQIDVEIVNADSTSFVTPQGVLDELQSQGVKLVGKRMGSIDASEIEEALKLSPYLESADIVKCQNGRLLIRVSQLVPIFRVFDGESSYYVNRSGKHMSANVYYHSDVPVVQGHFTRKYPATRLLPLINYVENDSLLHSLVSMYCVKDTNNIIIVPNISGHVINIGSADGFENKFAKLMQFYRQVMPKKGWETYDTISVKWNHQIVATRRVKAVQQSIQYDPEDDEQAPDIETMTVGSVADANRAKQNESKPEQDNQGKRDQENKKQENNKKSN